MSDTEAIRYRLEALGWRRKYKQLQAETAERLEKLEPWMVAYLLRQGDNWDECVPERFRYEPGEWAGEVDWLHNADEVEAAIAAAIHHAIGGDDA